MSSQPAVWFPAIRAGSGADVFTERLVSALQKRGIRAEITWLPHYAEFAPWLVQKPVAPSWATVVHCNSWLHHRLMPDHLPLVVTLHHCVHDPALDPYKSYAQRLYHRLWVRRLEMNSLGRARVRTAVSRYSARKGAEVFGQTDFRTIYNWIDTELFSPPTTREPGKPFRLLFVGNLIPRKGADLLPEIMRRLGDEYILHYTGEADGFASKTQLPPNMVPLGRLKGEVELIKAYRDNDVFLFPTRLEGFGLSVVEAQACGLPVVSTSCSSIPEVVEDGETGILCPMDDVDAFVGAITRLREDGQLWSDMSTAAAGRASQFSEEVALHQYIDIYRTLSG